MAKLEQLNRSSGKIAAQLDDPQWAPDPKRTDWPKLTSAIRALKENLQTEVLAELDMARAELTEAEEQRLLTNQVAAITAELGALLVAAGNAGEGRILITKARDLADGEAQNELDVGLRDLDNYVVLHLARWNLRHHQPGRADRLLAQVIRHTSDRRLKDLARAWQKAPRPIASAPMLGTFNTLGFALFGARDHSPDGTYVTTHCLTALFLPLLPLAAYRVLKEEGDRYIFHAKVPLSRMALSYRRLLVLGVLMGGVAWGLGAHLHSPSRLAGTALATAEDHDSAGRRDEAIAAYENIVQQYPDTAALKPASQALVRFYLADVPDPLVPIDVATAERAMSRIDTLPPGAKQIAAGLVARHLERWLGQLGAESVAATRASLRLARWVEKMPASSRDRLLVKRREIALRLADHLAAAWPLEALVTYVEFAGYASALEKAGAVLARLGDRPALWLAAAPEVRTWCAAMVNNPEHAAAQKRAVQRLAAAKKLFTVNQARTAMLADKDLKTLRRWLKKQPQDQKVAVAIAVQERAAGESGKAEKRLDAFGGPGWLIPEGQYLLAALKHERGDLVGAEKILEPVLDRRLERFRKLRAEIDERADSVREKMIRLAENGTLSAQRMQRLTAASEDEIPEVFGAMLDEELQADGELSKLRQAYDAAAKVAPAALTLGMVKLQLANQQQGARRRQLLSEAESAFLAIKSEAVGLPDFHLALGQVFYRLGRTGEGDKELAQVLAMKEPALSLAVARTYRELGLIGRARPICETIVESRETPHASNAAAMLATMASDLDDREKWLQRADRNDPTIQTELLEVRGHRFYRAGDLEKADKTFAAVAQRYAQSSAHDAVAANNQALMYQARYRCNGDHQLLSRATAGLEASLRGVPDNALVMGNLADVYFHAALVRVLGQVVETRLLRPTSGSASGLLGSLLRGPQRQALLAAVARDRDFRRSRELTDREEVLAPNKPDPYLRRWLWLTWQRDNVGLADLHRQLGRTGMLDTTTRDDVRQELESGQHDARRLKELAAELARLDRTLARARKKEHPPTIATALRWRAETLILQAMFSVDLTAAEAGVAAYRESAKTWPALSSGESLAYALLQTGALRLAPTVERCRRLVSTDFRRLGISVSVYRLSQEPEGRGVLTTLRAQPEVKEALALLARLPPHQLGLEEWALAQTLGGAALRRQTANVPTRRDVQLGVEIAAALFANEPRSVAKLALWRDSQTKSPQRQTPISSVEQQGLR